MRVNSALHRRLPHFRLSFDLFFRRLKHGNLAFRALNNKAYLATTIYWRSRPLATFGMWEGDGDAWFKGTMRRVVDG